MASPSTCWVEGEGSQARRRGIAPGDCSYQPSSEPTHSSGKMSAVGHNPNPQRTSTPKTRHPEPLPRDGGPRLWSGLQPDEVDPGTTLSSLYWLSCWTLARGEPPAPGDIKRRCFLTTREGLTGTALLQESTLGWLPKLRKEPLPPPHTPLKKLRMII